MNGDAQQLMNKMIEIQTLQEERHTENKSDLKIIFKKLEKLDNLPCSVHAERMKWYDRWLLLLGSGLLFVIGMMIKIHFKG